MGLNARSAVDPRWTNHHRHVVADFALASIKVIRKDPTVEPTYNQSTGAWTGNFITVFTGNARVKPYGIVGDMIVAQDTTGRRLMRVTIDSRNTGINIDDMIIVTAAPNSPELLNFELEVRGTIGSSDSWMTDLVAEANLKANL
jgi:hypothetical protein